MRDRVALDLTLTKYLGQDVIHLECMPPISSGLHKTEFLLVYLTISLREMKKLGLDVMVKILRHITLRASVSKPRTHRQVHLKVL